MSEAQEAAAAATPAKAPKMVDKDYDVETKLVSFSFSDGSTMDLDLSELKPEIVTRLALHGAIQKGGDSYAGIKNVAEAKESVRKVFEQLKAGEWSTPRGEGEGKPRIGELVQALAKVTSKSIEEVTKIVEAADEDKRKVWRAVPAVQAAALEIRAAKAAAKAAAAAAAGEATLVL